MNKFKENTAKHEKASIKRHIQEDEHWVHDDHEEHVEERIDYIDSKPKLIRYINNIIAKQSTYRNKIYIYQLVSIIDETSNWLVDGWLLAEDAKVLIELIHILIKFYNKVHNVTRNPAKLPADFFEKVEKDIGEDGELSIDLEKMIDAELSQDYDDEENINNEQSIEAELDKKIDKIIQEDDTSIKNTKNEKVEISSKDIKTEILETKQDKLIPQSNELIEEIFENNPISKKDLNIYLSVIRKFYQNKAVLVKDIKISLSDIGNIDTKSEINEINIYLTKDVSTKDWLSKNKDKINEIISKLTFYENELIIDNVQDIIILKTNQNPEAWFKSFNNDSRFSPIENIGKNIPLKIKINKFKDDGKKVDILKEDITENSDKEQKDKTEKNNELIGDKQEQLDKEKNSDGNLNQETQKNINIENKELKSDSSSKENSDNLNEKNDIEFAKKLLKKYFSTIDTSDSAVIKDFFDEFTYLEKKNIIYNSIDKLSFLLDNTIENINKTNLTNLNDLKKNFIQQIVQYNLELLSFYEQLIK